MAEFKQCPNGHYYLGAKCPYCKTNIGKNPREPEGTVPYDDPLPTDGPTVAPKGPSTDDPTIVIPSGPIDPIYRDPMRPGPTIIIDPVTGPDATPVPRSSRKLVGWLVSYTLDAMGVDFKLYEGRNIIGRDINCNITINDNTVSSKHAIILFRAGKYSITDQQSTQGTFVNGNDIDLEPCYIQDGDMIQMGNTKFKFRTSL